MNTETGPPKATTAELKRAGRALARARANAEEARTVAQEVGLRALSEGHTETAVARLLGVDRMTVRKWAGK